MRTAGALARAARVRPAVALAQPGSEVDRVVLRRGIAGVRALGDRIGDG